MRTRIWFFTVCPAIPRLAAICLGLTKFRRARGAENYLLAVTESQINDVLPPVWMAADCRALSRASRVTARLMRAGDLPPAAGAVKVATVTGEPKPESQQALAAEARAKGSNGATSGWPRDLSQGGDPHDKSVPRPSA